MKARAFLRAALRLALVLFLASLATFFSVELVPGDPAVATLGIEATPEKIEVARHELGLDRPVVERYLDWLGDALSGDLGHSLLRPASSVTELVKQSLPITLQLAAMGMVMALAMAVPLATWSAYREGSTFDRVTEAVTAAIAAVPNFLVALLLAYLFVFNPNVARLLVLAVGVAGVAALVWTPWRRRARRSARWRRSLMVRTGLGVVLALLTLWIVAAFPDLPRSGFSRLTSDKGLVENLRTAFLPAFTLALTEVAVLTRVLRTDLIATLQEDFILAARAKGMPALRVLWVDALRPSSFSLVTVAGVSLGRLIGGTVIVETVFGIQGVGRLVVSDGVADGDYPIVQGGVIVIAVVYVTLNLLVDLSYHYLDPRIRRA
jgi:peptide/nickel transport system permease protein